MAITYLQLSLVLAIYKGFTVIHHIKKQLHKEDLALYAGKYYSYRIS